MLPLIAIVGRPNVGKSTLFNRLVRARKALTHDQPGVTRDRIEAEADLDGRRVVVIDTGGMDAAAAEGSLDREVVIQADVAVTMAHVVLFVVDGREGLTGLDEEVAEKLRRSGKPVFLAVNKIDGEELESRLLSDFHALGFPLAPVSSAHGHGMSDLIEGLVERLPAAPEPADETPDTPERPLRLAMLGRPNAGKSSLVNALLGEQRVIVSEIAGTTRDCVDVTFERGGRRYTILDTAGVRRRARIDDGLERYSASRALSTAKRADVTVLVIDGPEGVAMQDKKLLSYLDKEKIPFMVAVNKIDLLDKAGQAALKLDVKEELRMVSHAPVLYVSALRGAGVKRMLSLAVEIMAECALRVGTGELNRVMRDVLDRHQAPMVGGRRAKFYYLTQSAEPPPTFVFFVNDAERVKPSYARYLENRLRAMFNLKMAPLKLYFRSSHEKKD